MKKVVRKTVVNKLADSSKKVSPKKQEVDLSLGLFLGVVSIGLSMLSLVQLNSLLSLVALSTGALAVWLSVRNKHYHVIFSGMAAMLVSLVGLSAYLNSISGY